MQPSSTIFFVCDIQTKFKNVIYGYDHVVSTANKLIKLAKLIDIEVLATTQNTKALGPIDPAIDLSLLGPLHVGTFDKTLFSMVIPEVQDAITSRPNVTSIVLFGIESHICILQTALDLLASKIYKVHIVADGVSSCNSFEISIAFERLRAAGALIETSESIAFQLMHDAGSSNFKAFNKLIKDEIKTTRDAGDALLQRNTIFRSPL